MKSETSYQILLRYSAKKYLDTDTLKYSSKKVSRYKIQYLASRYRCLNRSAYTQE